MLRRSAVVGGTVLWVTPTVSVLSATAAIAGSETAGGDGTPLDASYYILWIKCGSGVDATNYLVKAEGPDSETNTALKPLVITWGRGVSGAAWDTYDGVPASEPGIANMAHFADDGAKPDDVALYVVDGALWLDLDVNRRGPACTLEYWIAHKGQSLFHQHTPAGSFDPSLPEPGLTTLKAFPLLVKEQGDFIRKEDGLGNGPGNGNGPGKPKPK
jgi:hypothetical protein